MTHVLLGDDDSPGADLAWLWVNAQQWRNARLTVLRAETPAFGAPPDDSGPHSAEPWRPLIEGSGFDHITFQVVAEDPRVALTTTDADLVVVGPADSGLGPRSIGSTTEWLLHDPPTPVLLARRGRSVRRAMVCADGSEHAAAAARELASLPWAAELEIDVLAVDDGRTETEAALDQIVEALKPTGATITRSVRRGRSPHREILHEIESSQPDLVVVGTHGLSTLRRMTLGSTANAVAQLAPCSVLVAA